MSRRGSVAQVGAVASLNGVRVAAPSDARVVGEYLEWRIGDDWEAGLPAEGCLSAFAALADQTDGRAFARFARRYGVLGIVPNGAMNGRPGCSTGDAFPPHAGEGADAWFQEPLAGWRAYASHARAVLALATALQSMERIDPYRVLLAAGFARSTLSRRVDSDHPLTDEDRTFWGRFGYLGLPMVINNLERVGSADPSVTAYSVAAPGARQRVWFGHHVAKTWLAHAAIAPDIAWTGGTPRVTLTMSDFSVRSGWHLWPENTLVSVLAVQLAAALCSEAGLVPCEVCAVPFEKHRVPRCPACRREARNRRSARDMGRSRARRTLSPTPNLTPFLTPKPVDDHGPSRTVERGNSAD